MGDAAEDILDGTCCQQCGEWMDDILNGSHAPGYPRTCAACGGDEPERCPGNQRKRPARTCQCVVPGCKKLFRPTTLYSDYLMHVQSAHMTPKQREPKQ